MSFRDFTLNGLIILLMHTATYIKSNIHTYSYTFEDNDLHNMCDWILENRPKCHTWPIPFISPADSHTHTLPVHRCIDRPS